MQCLYCDRPLALLKRLTGDGEFCSKEHRRIYQQEHNQLALARLLASQPKPKEKPRPVRAQDVKPEPEIVEPVQPPAEARVPTRAGFMPESLDAGPSSGATRSAGAPDFKQGDPIWSGIEPRSRSGDRPGPKATGFLVESSGLSSVAGATPLQGKLDFKSPVGTPLLEEKRLSTSAENVSRPQPAGAGFVFEQSAGRSSLGATRPPAGARFSPLTPATASPGDVSSGGSSKLRMAKFLSGSALERPAPGAIRLPAIETRWKRLSPVLPTQAPGKIILVLGAFLQRTVRPASQDLPPEIFEIPFQPISYPRYSPGMGRLEDRLHRTDRIGFSPP